MHPPALLMMVLAMLDMLLTNTPSCVVLYGDANCGILMQDGSGTRSICVVFPLSLNR